MSETPAKLKPGARVLHGFRGMCTVIEETAETPDWYRVCFDEAPPIEYNRGEVLSIEPVWALYVNEIPE